ETPPRAQWGRFPVLRTNEVELPRGWIDRGAEWPKGVALAATRVGGSGVEQRTKSTTRMHPCSRRFNTSPQIRVVPAAFGRPPDADRAGRDASSRRPCSRSFADEAPASDSGSGKRSTNREPPPGTRSTAIVPPAAV